MMDNETLRDLLGEAVMFATRGYKNRTDSPREWDPNNDDSQFSMVLEDVDIVLARMEELGILPARTDNINVQAGAMTGSLYPPTVTYAGGMAGGNGAGGYTTSTITFPSSTPRATGIKKTATLTLELSAGSNLEELEEYVETLKSLGVSPDDVVVSSTMKYVVNLTDCGIERIDCGECGYNDYIIFPSDHECVLD